MQVYGDLDADQDVEVPPMNGFILNYARDHRADNEGADIMKCFAPEMLPVTTALANEFGVVDGWFCSVAGPTMPNRYYLMSASSAGVADNGVGARPGLSSPPRWRVSTLWPNMVGRRKASAIV